MGLVKDAGVIRPLKQLVHLCRRVVMSITPAHFVIDSDLCIGEFSEVVHPNVAEVLA